jgi:hypothetical protein
MGGWKVKILFLAIIYFAGFATAVYCLTPAHANPALHAGANTFVKSDASAGVKTEEFKQNCYVAISRLGVVAKDTACSAYQFVRQKLDERQGKEKLVARRG